LKALVKKLIFPGVNLHARCRYHEIPRLFQADLVENANVLDAGCGNGMLSFQAWKLGATVLGVSIKQKEVDGCKAMFNVGKGIPEDRLRFENVNLYDMVPEQHQFDAILCTEVLEHIRDDVGICRKFFDLLKPGGTLHVTSPNANHPYNVAFPLDLEEKGGHVRPGYNEQAYRDLLEPLGFEVLQFVGLGGPIRQAFNHRIKEIQAKFGTWSGVPLFLLSLPFLPFDLRDPKVPFSIYVKARKPGAGLTLGNAN